MRYLYNNTFNLLLFFYHFKLLDVDILCQNLLSKEWGAMKATTANCLQDEVVMSKFLSLNVFKLVFNIFTFEFIVKLLFGNLSEILFHKTFVVHNEGLIMYPTDDLVIFNSFAIAECEACGFFKLKFLCQTLH